MIATLSTLFKKYTGVAPETIVPLSGAGSERMYFRISAGLISLIGTWGPSPKENKTFVSLSHDFCKYGLAVPEVYEVSDDYHCYLQQDLGDVSLFKMLHADDLKEIMKISLERLVDLQTLNPDAWIHDTMHAPFCSRQVMWDLNYFKYEYVKPSGAIFDEDRLEDDFESLCRRLVGISKSFWGFMMRDCQSRNIMLSESGPMFIDFQGGRFGPLLYDVVSLLWQARAGFSDHFRQDMVMMYADCLCKNDCKAKAELLSSLDDMILFRTLQVLGAYGFRGLVQKKSHFIISIPSALRNLADLVQRGVLDNYPEIKKLSQTLVDDRRFADKVEMESCCNLQSVGYFNRLKVEIFSFSYKKGYPEDFSGNGGGFMFDCRAMHNPGRYAEYRSLTGRDLPVADFLEKRGEVGHFLNAAWAMVDPAVERYLSRGFSNLQIGFGCTGGQHRSVYCAEHTATHLRSLFPETEVVVTHREHP